MFSFKYKSCQNTEVAQTVEVQAKGEKLEFVESAVISTAKIVVPLHFWEAQSVHDVIAQATQLREKLCRFITLIKNLWHTHIITLELNHL